jgi:tRNA splicing endonuclease
VTGWQSGAWSYPEALKVAPTDADLAPWERSDAQHKARILRLKVEANRRALAAMDATGDQLWDQRTQAPRNSVTRLQLSAMESMNRSQIYNLRDTLADQTEALRALEPLS